jgi:hypothetical protein
MLKMVCLANSIREGLRCVAGIDLSNGRWVRPVPPNGRGIPTHCTFIGEREIRPLDIVQVDLSPPLFNTRYQCENRVMPSYNRKLVGSLTPSEIEEYCDDTSPILHTHDKGVTPDYLETLEPENWKSLQLVRVTDASFQRNYFKSNRWEASFSDSEGHQYCLKITDPIFCKKLENSDEMDRECMFTVSLAEEAWSPNEETPKKHYKLIAAVIEL